MVYYQYFKYLETWILQYCIIISVFHLSFHTNYEFVYIRSNLQSIIYVQKCKDYTSGCYPICVTYEYTELSNVECYMSKIIALYCYLIYSEGWISHYYIIIYVFHLCLTNYEIWYISKWDYRSRRTMKRIELEMYSIDCIIFWIQLYVILDSYG